MHAGIYVRIYVHMYTYMYVCIARTQIQRAFRSTNEHARNRARPSKTCARAGRLPAGHARHKKWVEERTRDSTLQQAHTRGAGFSAHLLRASRLTTPRRAARRCAGCSRRAPACSRAGAGSASTPRWPCLPDILSLSCGESVVTAGRRSRKSGPRLLDERESRLLDLLD